MIAPLAGYRIGVTGHRRSEEQVELLARRGADVVLGPVLHTDLLHDAEATTRSTELALAAPIDVLVLTTGIGTRSWFVVAESTGLDGRLRAAGRLATVLARGPKARAAAEANGLAVHWQATGETGAEVLARLREDGVAGRRVVVQRDGGAPVLAAAIAELGAEVIDVPVYRWRRPDDVAPAVRLLEAATAARVHAVTFTCAYAVHAAFELAPDARGLRSALDEAVVAAAVGPVTATALRAQGVRRVVEPGRARLGAMVQALVAELSVRNDELALGDVAVRRQGDLLVHPDGATAMLTPREARVLDDLVRCAPAVVPKRALAGPGADLHAVESAVGRLRGKLGPLADGIRTVPRRGYACDLVVGDRRSPRPS